MKKCFLTGLLAVCLLSTMAGCSASSLARQLEAAENTAEDTMHQAVSPAPAAIPEAPVAAPRETDAARQITQEEAQRIAFDHVGLTIDQVQRLHTDFEIDDGVSHYDVEFFTDNLKYEFKIDAQTGKILSFDKDDRRD